MSHHARSERRAARAWPHAEFLVLRAPLMAREALSRWVEGARALDACDGDDELLTRALDDDRALLRSRLAAIAADEHVAGGIELASSDLADGVARWRKAPGAKAARSAERSLVRYVTRLASRPDLFGNAGAYGIARFADPGRLDLPPRTDLDVRAQIDSSLLRETVRRAASEAFDHPDLLVMRNSGCYRVGGRLRVAARKSGGTGHRLVAIRPSPSIELALELAAGCTTVGSLVDALAQNGFPPDHAPKVVRRLLLSELLVPVADVTVTGRDPTRQAIEALEAIPGAEAAAGALRRAAGALAASPGVVRRVTADAVATELREGGIEVERRSCLQVDARRRGEAQVPAAALAEMRRAIGLLGRVAPPPGDGLAAFRKAFERRFATRSIPLLEALDPDYGIRLTSLRDEAAHPRSTAHGARRRRVLLGLLERGRATGIGEIELTERDVEQLSPSAALPLPAGLGMLTSITARDAEAISAGDFRLIEPVVTGTPGPRLLGRLCRGDEELEELVREELAREAELTPDAIIAEISVSAETQGGLNVVQRPVLREWEIVYGGGSGAPPDRRIEPSDLLLSVEGDEVVLRSASLGRRVVPLCTTAMNSAWVSLPAARFLLGLAGQRTMRSMSWSWDELVHAPALPRVTHGRTILALRRWNVPASELTAVEPGTDAAGFRRLQRWREERGIPRLVGFDHPKSTVLVDFGNVLSVDAFLASTRGFGMVRLVESPVAQPSPVHGPDGSYAHQVIVPFTVGREPASSKAAAPTWGQRTAAAAWRPRPAAPERARRFAPGSEWLYARLYGPQSATDRVLTDHVGPLARRLREAGLADRWFFVRYADPDLHLRVRFHGESRSLAAQALPALYEALVPALDDGSLYRISLDTYEREIERYGGVAGTELMEEIAQADSDAVIEIIGRRTGEVERRHLAVVSVAALYAGAGLPLEARRSCSDTLRRQWAPRGRSLGSMLGASERAERAALAEKVAELGSEDAGPGVAALRARSARLALPMARLRGLSDEEALERPVVDVMCSLAHMAVNRLMRRGSGNFDEVRIHDALTRLYDGQIARERPRSRAI